MLGYPEAISDTMTEMITRPNYVTTLASVNSFVDAPLLSMKEVTIGQLTVKNLEFIAFDLPQETRIDAILGRNFLERVKAKIDYHNRVIELEG